MASDLAMGVCRSASPQMITTGSDSSTGRDAIWSRAISAGAKSAITSTGVAEIISSR